MQTRREAVQAIEQYSGKLVGRILLGGSTIPGTYILPELISGFRTQYPSIKATLSINSSRIISKKVLEGELEFGVVGARWNNKGLSWNEIFSDELTRAVHPVHSWASKKRMSIQDVIQEPFILREPESGTRKVFSKILENNGLNESSLREVVEIGSTAAIKEAVKAGIGISILSRRAVKDEVDCGRLVAVAITENRMNRPFYLIQRKIEHFLLLPRFFAST